MKISITEVTQEFVTVSGQPLARAYVEDIMLPMLMAQCGRDNAAKAPVIAAFIEAGLSVKAIREDATVYLETKRIQEAERAQLQREADARAESLRERTPREIAQAAAEREKRNAAIREHGERIRAASRNNGW